VTKNCETILTGRVEDVSGHRHQQFRSLSRSTQKSCRHQFDRHGTLRVLPEQKAAEYFLKLVEFASQEVDFMEESLALEKQGKSSDSMEMREKWKQLRLTRAKKELEFVTEMSLRNDRKDDR